MYGPLNCVWSKETCPRFRPLPGIELGSLTCKASALTTELQDSTNLIENASFSPNTYCSGHGVSRKYKFTAVIVVDQAINFNQTIIHNSSLHRLQIIQNSAACVLSHTRLCDPTTPILA
uniref:Uncharacterized protein n=1 Tax=Callorhinchus milii TaxID=7868 RepID=A0A4W3JCX8_CALMI